MLNLDTHVLIALLGDELRPEEEAAIVRDQVAVSAIVLWELAKLVQLKRVVLDLDDPDFKSTLREITVLPITLEIARISTQLDFRSDPADELIAATSVVHDMPLLTRDARIRTSKLVPFADAPSADET
jgi:PIN domain nuclease of toxin-antitoxin system